MGLVLGGLRGGLGSLGGLGFLGIEHPDDSVSDGVGGEESHEE